MVKLFGTLGENVGGEIGPGLQRLSWKTFSVSLMQATSRGFTQLGDFLRTILITIFMK